jgi:hypothetical protein
VHIQSRQFELLAPIKGHGYVVLSRIPFPPSCRSTQPLLFVKFRGRSVAVSRDFCDLCPSPVHAVTRRLRVVRRWSDRVAGTGHHNERTTQLPIPVGRSPGGYRPHGGDPRLPDEGQVELPKEICSMVSAVVHSVTIGLESGA